MVTTRADKSRNKRVRPTKNGTVLSVVLLVAVSSCCIIGSGRAFHPVPCSSSSSSCSTSRQRQRHRFRQDGTYGPLIVHGRFDSTPPPPGLRMSFVGGKGGDGNNNNNGNNNNEDFLPDPDDNKPESEADRETRRQRADARLPINFRSDDGTRDEEFDVASNNDDDTTSSAVPPPADALASALERRRGEGAPLAQRAADNPYLRVVSALSPSEIITRFTMTANPKVQAAAKQTILGLIGSLPKMAFEVNVVTSGAKLASLMFQLQMTGYMFKNAEYRLEVDREFGRGGGGTTTNTDGNYLLGGGQNDDTVDVDPDDDDDAVKVKDVRGKIRVNYDSATTRAEAASASSLPDMEVDASAFTSELRDEVERLREELRRVRSAKEEKAVQQDLMSYIRTLPPREIERLTNTMSDDVLTGMKGLVSAVMLGIDGGAGSLSGATSGGEDGSDVSPGTLLEQSGEAMAQLCMWQLVVGYNLRELEVREEMKEKVSSLSNNNESGGTNAALPANQEEEEEDDDFDPGLESGGME